jgi:hypothetical protein
MAWLNEIQTQQIADFIAESGLTDDDLYTDLLDHLCCMTEQMMDKGEQFETALLHTLQHFSGQAIQDIQHSRDELFNLNYKTMNRNTFISGLFAGCLICIGSFFKFMHWPGASISIILGIFTLIAAFIPLMFIQAFRAEFSKAGKAAQISGLISVNLALAGFLFKLFHWPYPLVLFSIALAIAVLIYLPLLLYKNSLEISTLPKNRFVSVVFLLVVGGVTLLGLRSSSNKLDITFTITNSQIEALNEKLKAKIEGKQNIAEVQSKYQLVIPVLFKIQTLKNAIKNSLSNDASYDDKELKDLPYTSTKLMLETSFASNDFKSIKECYQEVNTLLKQSNNENDWIEVNIKNATVITAYTQLSILELQLYQYCLLS